MLNMEILALLLAALSLAAAQYPPRNPGFRNTGFRNIRTPLATSATRDRPFISIPIVLLPDGQPVPKPKQSTYHYVGHATQNVPRTQNQRNVKQRGPIMSKSVANYQVAIPPPVATPQPKKIGKPPKLTATQLSSQLRNPPSNFQRSRGHGQNFQQNQPHRGFQQNLEQNQQVQIQYVKPQRNPTYEHQSLAPSQQAVAAHKQNVENFVNFATNLGASIASHHQTKQVILPTQTPATGLPFQNNLNLRATETYLNQRPLLANHKLGNGVTFQHQVPSLSNAQSQYTQVIQNNEANQNNVYTSQLHTQLPSSQQHQQQFQNSQQSQQQLQTSHQPQQQLRNSQVHQQHTTNPQVQQHQLANSQGHQQQLTNSQAHQQQLTNSQAHQQQLTNSQAHQQQLTNSHVHQQQLTNSQLHQQLTNSHSQQESNSQQEQEPLSSQQPPHSFQSPSPIGSYLSASSVQPSTSQTQVTGLSNSASTQGNQANFFQQNGGSYRNQPSSNDVVLLDNYNSQNQQSNQQTYAVSSPQQQTIASQVASSYDSHSDIPKTVLPDQQPTSTSTNTQNTHNSYLNQNQDTQGNDNLNSQGQQIIFPSNIQSASGFPLHQIAEINAFSLQNAQFSNGQNNNPVYFHYQTAQDLPSTYSALFNQAQAGYLSSQNSQQPDTSNADQSYSSLPDIQNVFTSNGQSIYTSPQDDSSSSDSSSSEVTGQNYDSYPNDQSAYSSSTSGQTNQGSFINTSNLGKSYQNSQYNYLLQNSPESQTGQSNENQHSQSSSTITSGPLIYASSSKQLSYSPSASSISSDSQQYSPGNYQQSPTYISFTTANTNLKSDAVSALNYAQRSQSVITPGSTYAKSSETNGKQSQASSEVSGSSEDSEYEEDDDNEEEEASYKVVYIPLDILKNILSNSVENQSHS